MCKITKFQLTNIHSDSIIKIRKVPPLNRLYRRFALDIVTRKQLYLCVGRLLFLCSFRSRSLNTKSPVDDIAPTTLAMLCILQKHKCIYPHPVNIFIWSSVYFSRILRISSSITRLIVLLSSSISCLAALDSSAKVLNSSCLS